MHSITRSKLIHLSGNSVDECSSLRRLQELIRNAVRVCAISESAELSSNVDKMEAQSLESFSRVRIVDRDLSTSC